MQSYMNQRYPYISRLHDMSACPETTLQFLKYSKVLNIFTGTVVV
jgi:hypothetical protein